MDDKKKTACPLLELAAELRNLIWENVFDESTITYQGQSQKPKAPGLLLVSKQIHSEAIGAYYRLSNFEFANTVCLRRTIHRLPQASLRLIGKIRIQFMDYDSEQNLSHLTGRVAYKAQESIFLARQKLKTSSHPNPDGIIIETTVQDFEGRMLLTVSLWLKYAELLTAKLETQCVARWGVTDLQKALDQATFFEHEHERPLICWRMVWLRGHNNHRAIECKKKTTD